MIDPKHDYEDESVVKLRLGGGLQQRMPCLCHLCRMFDLEEGPMLVPTMRDLPNGERVFTGRWLHGAELRKHLAARREMLAGMKRAIAGLAEVG